MGLLRTPLKLLVSRSVGGGFSVEVWNLDRLLLELNDGLAVPSYNAFNWQTGWDDYSAKHRVNILGVSKVFSSEHGVVYKAVGGA